MKKLILLSLMAILTSSVLYSQDTIVKKNGEMIICKIQREANGKVFFTTGSGYNETNDIIDRSEISTINYERQPSATDVRLDKTSFGFGLGMDYGGIGVNFLVYPQRNIGIFGGGGYALAGIGFNVGTKIRFISESSKSKSCAYALAMYGYNAAISVTNAPTFNKLFYGVTLGVGIDFNANSAKRGYWSLALLVPIRGEEVDSYINDLKNNHGVQFKNELFPIGFSIGYRFKSN